MSQRTKLIVFLLLSVLAYLGGAYAASADPHRIFWSPNGQNLGSPKIAAYAGSSAVAAMTAYNGGVLTAFAGAGRGYRIHWAAHGENLGGGPIVYDGSSPVTAMIEYQGGVLTAFSKAGGNGNRIWFSPNGQNLGGGELRYDGSSPITAMAPYAGGVLVAFSNAGGNGYRVWFSPDGKTLGGGQLVYDGSSPVVGMLPYDGGVLTAFTKAGPNGNRIHWSPNGQGLGAGPIVYDGGSPVMAMIAYRGGVLTAFTNAGPNKNRIHWSTNGQNLGGGEIRYDGSTVVRTMLPYNDGVFTAFINDDRGSKCGGPGDVACNLVQVIAVGSDQLRQAGREFDQMRLKFLASVVSGPALEQWLNASRNSSINGAMQMPPEMRDALQGWYSPKLMDKVRFKIGDGGELNLANNAIRFGQATAVTLIDVIVFKGPSEAVCPSLWAHEMKHIQQFDDWGVHSFSVQYMRSSNTVENPAYDVEQKYRQQNPQRC
ncbi:eCIS core domain-containing protein [Bradyrhizobium septentrionale]|uniref:DUF4157 domain-containing protein n=1 Tax=Bradyrhizobium septentrionale TaxID=1404411 RepID=A0ABZ2P3N3_9BRAD